MRVQQFKEIREEFIRRVARDLCCNLATVDKFNRVRSRAVHPLWEGHTAWLLTDRRTPKLRHIEHNPCVSLAYIGDNTSTAYAECNAEIIQDPDERQRVWELFQRDPLGYDPAPFYGQPEHPDLVVLKLEPWRIQIDDSPGETIIWEPE